MDQFLRRVVEQRSLEQEVAILATPVESFLRSCRVCLRRITGGTDHAGRVCVQCGGLRVDARLRAADAVAAARAKRTVQLLQLAGLQPLTPEHVMADPRKCEKCSKVLHGRIIGKVCKECRDGVSASAAPNSGGGQDSNQRRKAKPDVVKRFKVVAGALGVDPDNLIAEFCEGWLERVRSSANFGTDS